MLVKLVKLYQKCCTDTEQQKKITSLLDVEIFLYNFIKLLNFEREKSKESANE